jgi:hypothetical protein
VNINHSEKMEQKNIPCNKEFPKKCGDKEAPVATFVANAFLPLDTAVLNQKPWLLKRSLKFSQVQCLGLKI